MSATPYTQYDLVKYVGIEYSNRGAQVNTGSAGVCMDY